MSNKKNIVTSNLGPVRNFLFVGAGLVWAFAGLDGALSKDLDSSVFAWFARIGGLMLAIALIIELIRRFSERGSLERMFEAKKVTRGEIRDAIAFSQRFLPEVPSEAQLRDIHEASRGCVWFVNSCKFGLGTKKSERVGFFSIIRLTDDAIRLYETNNLSGFQLSRTHIAGPRARARALYIGGLGAKGVRAKGWIIQHLRSRIDVFFEDNGEVVYTRPVTEDGLRLATKLGFAPVSDRSGLGNIYKLTG